MRLDKYVVDKKIIDSRTKAQDLISNGFVVVNNKIVTNSAYKLNDNDIVEVNQHDKYVSRGAYKLIAAINKFKINLKDKVVMDIGSSTGGFSQVCLINGAKKIYAIDVGKNQMNDKLKNNSKIELHEQLNFKDVKLNLFRDQIDFIVVDVSFISVTKILEKISELFFYPLKLIILIKPQFELGKEIIKANRGVIKNKKLWDKAIDIVSAFVKKLNYKINSLIVSPIKGGDGNKEFLMYLDK
ncbi:MAG: TlyA family RNA methyltransferase [Mycoplasma sp.]|nr:TlyA family RNA methyltransferase [Mycoplasma sp.]